MNDLSNIKAVIFDMDGVLFNSNEAHRQAYSEILAEFNIPDFNYERDAAGRRTDETIRTVLARNLQKLAEFEVAQIVTAKQSKARELLAAGGGVAAESADLVNQLAQKFRLAVATSASRGTVDIFLSKAGYGDMFEFVLDGSSVERAKPDPGIYLLASEKLEVAPDECIVVEDGVSGIRAAVAAGMRVIGITSTDDESSLREAGATYIVSNLLQVADLLIKE